MPEIFINGQPVQARRRRDRPPGGAAQRLLHPVLLLAQVAVDPRQLPDLRRAARRQELGRDRLQHAGRRRHAGADRLRLVRAHRKATLQFITLNHPVDCGICDKAGECTLQDYHFEYNGERSISIDTKVRSTKYVELSERIVLDNERCILCTRCVRFTREISKSNALGVKQRGDESLVRASEDGAFDRDAYSDNVVDICPVGALLSRSFLQKSRVWYLKPTPSVCPGCARGCTVNLWHRKPEWKLRALDPQQNVSIARVTPLENPAVNGPWICNKGRDLAQIFERARAAAADAEGQAGRPAGGDRRRAAADRRREEGRWRWCRRGARTRSSPRSRRALGDRFTTFVKADHVAGSRAKWSRTTC